VLANDHFFCLGCLEDKPAGEQSPDSRYCKGCCEFLLNEAKMLTGGKRPSWIPKVNREAPPSMPEPLSEHVEQARDCDKISIGVSDRVRGRKPINIPVELINNLVKEGFTSCRAISQRLKGYGIDCSYRTVARVIKDGEQE
jgi:hypothetical protein